MASLSRTIAQATAQPDSRHAGRVWAALDYVTRRIDSCSGSPRFTSEEVELLEALIAASKPDQEG